MPESHDVPPDPPAGPAEHPSHPGTGSADPQLTELRPEEEPVTTGTVFLTLIILMIIAAVWITMYRRLLAD
jgi:hypothetical protein